MTKWLRLSLRSSMLMVFLFALTITCLRYPTALTASLLYTVTLLVMLTGVLGAVVSLGRRRSGWFGLALFGTTYLAIAFSPYAWLNNDGLRPPPLSTLAVRSALPVGLVNSYWSSRVSTISSQNSILPASASSMSIGPAGPIFQARDAPGEQVLHCLASLFFASLGFGLGHLMSSQAHPLPK